MSRSHHTKDKGDQGLGFVIASLLSHKIQVALPISEHLPFDLIAIGLNGQLRKISVKFRSLKEGKVEVLLRSSWSNARGTHNVQMEKGAVDAHAVYCPNTRECYFIRDDQVTANMFTLRVEPPKNGQRNGMRMAAAYTNPQVIFDFTEE
jgi:hypothetical protein